MECQPLASQRSLHANTRRSNFAQLLVPAAVGLIALGSQFGAFSSGSGNVIEGPFPRREPDERVVFVSYHRKDRRFWLEAKDYLASVGSMNARIHSHQTIGAGLDLVK